MIHHFLSPELVHAIGWTLVHSLWQAAVFALALGFLLIGLRKFSARARYNLSIGMLAAFFLTVVLTFGNLYKGNTAISIASAPPAASPLSRGEEPAEMARAERSSASTNGGSKSGIEHQEAGIEDRIILYYNTHLPLIVTLWLMGVLILQLRFLGQLAYLQRLKNYGAERFPARLAPVLQEIEAAIGISKPVRYLTSFRVGSPFTAGWWRPVVLFPSTLLAELNEPELRSIIAHELAHVRRHDFLVNLSQTLVCILFFYHPAVWWMSARIEDEREHCCDDLAVKVTGERVGYAKTLIQLKEREAGPAIATGFLGKGGGFKQRVTRLLSGYLGTGTYGEGFTSAVIIACIMVAAVTLSAQGKGAEAEPEVAVISAGQNPPALTTNPREDRAERSVRPETPEGASVSHVDIFDETGEMVNFVMPSGDSTALVLLMEAIDDGNVGVVRYLIGQGIDVNAADRNGWTPLMMAASENQAGVMRLLIEAGADVNFVSRDGWTALIEAADEGSYECAEILLQAGADVNLTGPGNNRTPIAMAGSEGHTHLFALLVQAGADIFSVNGKGSPLHEAAEAGRLDLVKRLLDLGADAGARDQDGRAPLSYAAEEGHVVIVEYLLDKGVNPDDAGDEGRTALSYAAEEGKVGIVKMLIAAGANTMIPDQHGMTALDHAVDELDHESKQRNRTTSRSVIQFEHPIGEVIAALVRAGATSDRVKTDAAGKIMRFGNGDGGNSFGDYSADPPFGTSGKAHSGDGAQTSDELVEAVAAGQNQRIDYLISRGDNLNGITRNGRTPLTEASFQNYSVHTEQLVRGGADINRTDGDGYTPLTMAAQHNHTSTLDLLLRLGAKPDLTDGNGLAAKDIALRDGSVQILRLLNRKGANVTAVSRNGLSPLANPARDGYVAVLRFLLEEGVGPNAGTGPSPLFLATRERQVEAIGLLLRYKADPEVGWNYYDTDYFYRSVPGGGSSFAIYESATPLMMALTQADQASAHVLLRGGANANATCRKVRYYSPRKVSVEQAGEITEANLARKYRLTYEASGWTPLMEAVESGKTELVTELLKAGADKRMKTSGGITALSLAKELGFTEIAALL